MAFAGYDPDEAAEFWERMVGPGRGGLPEFLSDHPSPETRVRDLRQWAAEGPGGEAGVRRGADRPGRGERRG